MFLDGYDEPLYDCPSDVVTAYVNLLKMYIFFFILIVRHTTILYLGSTPTRFGSVRTKRFKYYFVIYPPHMWRISDQPLVCADGQTLRANVLHGTRMQTNTRGRVF